MTDVVWTSGRSLWSLVNFLHEQGAMRSDLIHRGQADARWKLVPALFRYPHHNPSPLPGAQLYTSFEDRLIVDFFDRAHLLLPQMRRSPLLDRALAQHYGVPTQLLDWTVDPMIALYFAVNDFGSTFDAAFYYCMPLRGAGLYERHSFPHSGPITKFFPPVIDERIRVQKSVFTIQSFGTEDGDKFVPLDDRTLSRRQPMEGTHPGDEVDCIGKIIIPAANKRQIFCDLAGIGVDRAALFPGLSGIGGKIADDIRLNEVQF